MAKQQIPFQAGDPATGEVFFDRKEILKELETLLGSVKEGIHQDIVLISPRRFGKTSLLLKLKERLEKNDIVVVYFDLSKVFPLTLENVLEKYIKEILISYSAKAGMKILPSRISEAIAGAPEAIAQVALSFISEIKLDIAKILTLIVALRKPEKKKKDVEELLEHALELPEKLAEKTKLNAVVIFDEFQLFKNFGEDIFWPIRARVQHHKKVAYIVCGSAVGMMTDIVSEKKSPFYNLFLMKKIGPFSDKDSMEFVHKRLKTVEVEIETEAMNLLLEKTKNIPFNLQWLGLNSYLLALQYGTRKIDRKIIEEAYETGLKTVPQFQKEFDALTSVQQRITVAMAMHNLNSPVEISKKIGVRETNVIRELGKLVDYGYATKPQQGHYEIRDSVFKDWILLVFGER